MGFGRTAQTNLDMIRSHKAKNMQRVLGHPDTYDFARGLALGSHSSSPSTAVVELSGRRVLPFLEPSPPSWGSLPFLVSPD